jgi:CubicO group peptidase (beta-lactamase class C family)
MKSSGLLVCLFLFILTASVIPVHGDTPIAGNVDVAIDEGIVTATRLSQDNGPSDPAEVEAFLDLVMPAAIARYNAPGATVAVVKDGRLVVAKGYGYNDLVNRTPIDGDTTIFRIGSISKLFTWTAAMQLVEEGKIDLDEDVNTYLKGMKIPDTYPGQPVTMRHLLTHTAGFEDTSLRMTWGDVESLISIQQYCAENIPARIYPPGKVSLYSNYGATLAAVVVEDVSGMPFDQYLQSRIFTPLGMDQTNLRQDLPQEFASRLTKGYKFANSENLPAEDYILTVGPAGSISSTAPDMAKFLIAHLQNGTYGNATILSPGTTNLMHSWAFSVDPRVSGMCLGFYEQHYNGRRTIGHGGDTDTFHSHLCLLPDEQVGFFVSSNSAGGRGVRDELFKAFMDRYYPGEPIALPEPDPSASARLQHYAGTYEMNRHNYARFERYIGLPSPITITATPEGTLRMASSDGVVEYIEGESGVFFPADGSRPIKGNIVFHTAPDGSVDYFAYTNVPVMVYSRLPWYMTADFQDNLKTAAGIILGTVLLWPLLFLFRHTYAIPEPSNPKMARIARWSAGIAALLLIAFVYILLPWSINNEGMLLTYIQTQEIPGTLTAVLTVPVIAAVLTVATIAFAVLAWKEKYWTFPHRVHYTIITIALVAMLWWVHVNRLWVFCL